MTLRTYVFVRFLLYGCGRGYWTARRPDIRHIGILCRHVLQKCSPLFCVQSSHASLKHLIYHRVFRQFHAAHLIHRLSWLWAELVVFRSPNPTAATKMSQAAYARLWVDVAEQYEALFFHVRNVFRLS